MPMHLVFSAFNGFQLDWSTSVLRSMIDVAEYGWLWPRLKAFKDRCDILWRQP
jgi:hypothetical protein